MAVRWARARIGRQDKDSVEFGVPDWEPVTLTGGVASVLGTLAPGYYKDPFGVVHLRGYLAGAVGTLFSLPVGFRPGGTEVFDNGNVFVFSSGVVQSTAMPCSLAGVSFRPER